MAKSRDNFHKEDFENKKNKKKKEKGIKKAERKASSNKTKSFEDMIAYVDENGNIVSTPPDPTKKKAINQEDIQINISKQDGISEEKAVKRGIVTFFNESKGYGFIKDLDTKDSIFVHVKGLKEPVKENDKVTFDVTRTPKGLNAINVKLI